MAEHIDTRPLYRRAIGKSLWFSVNTMRRTWSRTGRLYESAAATLYQTRRTVRRALGKAFWNSVSAMKRARKNATRVRRHAIARGRYTPTGRAIQAVADAVRSPGDAFQRKTAALSYLRAHPNAAMTHERGYAMLPPGSLPGADQIIALCQHLFEEKKRKLEAAEGPNTELHAKKWAFMRSVLTNEDLAQHPELVDFALSDALLSAVANYFGTIPHLNRIDLLYSVSHGGDEAVSSQIYHLDPEGRKQAKLFLNLRDVGPAEGPFTFIPADDSTAVMRAIKESRAPEAEMAMARFLDSELEAAGGLQKAVSVQGPTGTAGLVDTSRCLHCGSRVKPGTYRLCLYIQYCTSREHGNVFDVSRYASDPVRYLATINSQRSAHTSVAAPHQMR